MKTGHRRAHRVIWGLLVLVLPAVLITAFVLKQANFENRPAVQLEPPRGTAQP